MRSSQIFKYEENRTHYQIPLWTAKKLLNSILCTKILGDSEKSRKVTQELPVSQENLKAIARIKQTSGALYDHDSSGIQSGYLTPVNTRPGTQLGMAGPFSYSSRGSSRQAASG
jgi:hypothetical protein